MKTGLPRHFTVSCAPTSTPEISTKIDANARVSAEGFIWLISGQTAAPVETAPTHAVA
jgi:hypothetical protein